MENVILYRYKIDKPHLDLVLDELWEHLRQDSALAKEARDHGIDLENVHKYSRSEIITVTKDGYGLDPASTALIVAFSPVAAKVTNDLWTKILLPWILRNKGKDALVPKK